MFGCLFGLGWVLGINHVDVSQVRLAFIQLQLLVAPLVAGHQGHREPNMLYARLQHVLLRNAGVARWRQRRGDRGADQAHGSSQHREFVQAVACSHGLYVCVRTSRVPVVIFGRYRGRMADILELLESHGGGGRETGREAGSAQDRDYGCVGSCVIRERGLIDIRSLWVALH